MRSEEKMRREELVAEMDANDRRSEHLLVTLMEKLNEIDARIARMEGSEAGGQKGEEKIKNGAAG